MAISPGTRLGPYEIVAFAGAGGMGQVWRARDTRLEREVAIKFVPAEFVQNAQLHARFDREARSISRLSHPHICTLYDVGQHDGLPYLVMEYLEGETLAGRLERGPLPLEQAIRYGIQIAEALDRAHKTGVVHRDLKPSNVMLTRSGAKLMDFGLAKPSGTSGDPLHLFGTAQRTVSAPLTSEGAIVGTLQYMAPEQLEGEPSDARTDIFALGILLYESVTARRPFDGKSKASVMAAILTSEPAPLIDVQRMTPPSLDRIVRTCLKKDPDERWQSAHDVAVELRWVSEERDLQSPPSSRRAAVAWSVAAFLALIAAASGGLLWRDLVRRRDQPLIRTFIPPPERATFTFHVLNGGPPAISPDGRLIVFGAAEPGKPRQLWIRPLEARDAEPLQSTENGSYPFWSPDSRSIAFFRNGKLEKIDLGRGGVTTICNADYGRGGSWSRDGSTIVFGLWRGPIQRIAATGGVAVAATTLAIGETAHRYPVFLPDNDHFIYQGGTGVLNSTKTIFVGSIHDPMRKPLLTGADVALYWKGFLVFTRDASLYANRFDANKLAMTGDAVLLSEQQIETMTGHSVITLSDDATLVYQAETPLSQNELLWFDRTGKNVGRAGQPSTYKTPAIAPDQQHIAVSYFKLGRSPENISIIDVATGVARQLTIDPGIDANPVWSPDGTSLAYSSSGPSGNRIKIRNMINGADRTLVTSSPDANSISPVSWARGGQIFCVANGKSTGNDIWWIEPDGSRHPYLTSPRHDWQPRISPDGKWVAYQSGVPGHAEVYLAPFPPTGAMWQVSASGGNDPYWRADGKEIYYIDDSDAVVAVPINLTTPPRIGAATVLFQRPVAPPGSWDVTRDGQRFLFVTATGNDPTPGPMIVVQHFDTELRAALAKR